MIIIIIIKCKLNIDNYPLWMFLYDMYEQINYIIMNIQGVSDRPDKWNNFCSNDIKTFAVSQFFFT